MKFYHRFVVFAVAACLSSFAFADGININNASFEDPVLSAGGNTWTNDYADWQAPDTPGNAFVEYIDGFSSDGLQHIGVQTGDEVSQDTGVALLPNSTYLLEVAIGNRNLNFTPAAGNASTFGLYLGADAGAGGTLLADSTVDAFPIGEGNFAEYSLTYTTGAAVDAGNIVVSLRTTGEGRAHYDNVRLSVVPEPCSMTLCLFGILGVVRLVRKR